MSAGNAGRSWAPWRLRKALAVPAGEPTAPSVDMVPQDTSTWPPLAESQLNALSDAARARNRLRAATAIGYAPDPTPTPRPVPAKVVSVTLTFDSGASIVYPVLPAVRLRGPPTRCDFVDGKAWLDRQ